MWDCSNLVENIGNNVKVENVIELCVGMFLVLNQFCNCGWFGSHSHKIWNWQRNLHYGKLVGLQNSWFNSGMKLLFEQKFHFWKYWFSSGVEIPESSVWSTVLTDLAEFWVWLMYFTWITKLLHDQALQPFLFVNLNITVKLSDLEEELLRGECLFHEQL